MLAGHTNIVLQFSLIYHSCTLAVFVIGQAIEDGNSFCPPVTLSLAIVMFIVVWAIISSGL